MKTTFLSIIFLSFLLPSSYSQALKKQLCDHTWQESKGVAFWDFEEDGIFAGITLKKEEKLVLVIKKGRYAVDDSTNSIKMSFDSTYEIHLKDTFLVKADLKVEDWQIKMNTDKKITISCPQIWFHDTINTITMILINMNDKRNHSKSKK